MKKLVILLSLLFVSSVSAMNNGSPAATGTDPAMTNGTFGSPAATGTDPAMTNGTFGSPAATGTDPAMSNGTVNGTTPAMVNQDGSVMTNGSSVQENNVMAGDTQVTDKQVVAGDQVVNMGAETSLTPLSEDNVEFNSAGLSGGSNNGVTMGNVEVDVLPTTGLEESLLILVSLFLSGLIIFRNKFIKK